MTRIDSYIDYVMWQANRNPPPDEFQWAPIRLQTESIEPNFLDVDRSMYKPKRGPRKKAKRLLPFPIPRIKA